MGMVGNTSTVISFYLSVHSPCTKQAGKIVMQIVFNNIGFSYL